MPTRTLLSATLALGLLASCAEPEAQGASQIVENAVLGNLIMPLTSFSGSTPYQLTGSISVFRTAPSPGFVHTVPLQQSVRTHVESHPAGTYDIILDPGWRMYRGDSKHDVTDVTALIDPQSRTRTVEIIANGSTHAVWRFEVQGQPVVFDPCLPDSNVPQCSTGDADGDGVSNGIECLDPNACVDSDSDGAADYIDVDSDDDGTPDSMDEHRTDPCLPDPLASRCTTKPIGNADLSFDVTERCDAEICTFGGDDANPSDLQIVQLAAGAYHTCALASDGRVFCWGANSYGQLGDGTDLSRSTPKRVLLAEPAAEISAGYAQTCARLTSGQVACWGELLGAPRLLPQSIVGVSEAVSLSSGATHSCAALGNGQVLCWGSNTSGELGDGTFESRAAPEPAELTNAIAMRLGHSHSCAVLQTHELACWGNNSSGQVGAPRATVQIAHPTLVPGIQQVVTVGGGGMHTCALLQNGEVRCWGSDSYGQLGNGELGSSHESSAIVGISRATGLASGFQHTCVLREKSATAQCWGRNDDGQLGDGQQTASEVPVSVVGRLGSLVEIVAGERHSCARAANRVYCWGLNSDGQLGTEPLGRSLMPGAAVLFPL